VHAFSSASARWLSDARRLSAAFQLAKENHKFASDPRSFHEQEQRVGDDFLWFLLVLQKYTADQTLVQRYLVAKTDRDALKASRSARCSASRRGRCSCSSARSPGVLQIVARDASAFVDKPDKVFPYFLATKCRPVSPVCSWPRFRLGDGDAPSDLNCLSVVGVEDYYRKLRPQATDKQRSPWGS